MRVVEDIAHLQPVERLAYGRVGRDVLQAEGENATVLIPLAVDMREDGLASAEQQR